MRNEQVYAKGKLFELVHVNQPDGRVFEVARRAPGVRLIIHNPLGRKVLLTKEYRNELKTWDYRLPGGKVFDSLEEYDEHRKQNDSVNKAAKTKAIAEGKEEAGISVEKLKLYRVSTLGATMEWDLYIFEVLKWQPTSSQKLEAGEQIETNHWFGKKELKEMILGGKMQEERVALVLLQWLEERIKNA